MPRPDLSTAPEWYQRYISVVQENELVDALNNQTEQFNSFFNSIPAEKIEFRYAEGKWSIKEIIQHILDTERVFAYRALRFARKDTTPLPGYDENEYAQQAKTSTRNWEDLLEEFNHLRNSSIIMFSSFDDEQLNESGVASGNPISVLTLGFIMAGHANHHIAVIKERYLKLQNH